MGSGQLCHSGCLRWHLQLWGSENIPWPIPGLSLQGSLICFNSCIVLIIYYPFCSWTFGSLPLCYYRWSERLTLGFPRSSVRFFALRKNRFGGSSSSSSMTGREPLVSFNKIQRFPQISQEAHLQPAGGLQNVCTQVGPLSTRQEASACFPHHLLSQGCPGFWVDCLTAVACSGGGTGDWENKALQWTFTSDLDFIWDIGLLKLFQGKK